MRVLLQRVSQAQVLVDGRSVAAIGRGYLLLTGIAPADTPGTVAQMAEKIVHLRLFNNELGKFDRSLLDLGAEALVVSQFTLFADARKGRRPSFTRAAAPETARQLVQLFAEELLRLGVPQVPQGRFGASMQVLLVNDGPVTLLLDSSDWTPPPAPPAATDGSAG